MVVGAEEARDRVDRRATASEGHRVLGVFQRREAGLERPAGRVGTAAVDVLARLAELELDVGGGGMDRRNHRAGCRIRLLPDVDGLGREALVFHGESVRVGSGSVKTTRRGQLDAL